MLKARLDLLVLKARLDLLVLKARLDLLVLRRTRRDAIEQLLDYFHKSATPTYSVHSIRALATPSLPPQFATSAPAASRWAPALSARIRSAR